MNMLQWLKFPNTYRVKRHILQIVREKTFKIHQNLTFFAKS